MRDFAKVFCVASGVLGYILNNYSAFEVSLGPQSAKVTKVKLLMHVVLWLPHLPALCSPLPRVERD